MKLLNELSGELIVSKKKLSGNITNNAKAISGSIICDGVRNLETYQGSYNITPTGQTQILLTNDMRLGGNITINPIPSNYGLITWDGSAITVS